MTAEELPDCLQQYKAAAESTEDDLSARRELEQRGLKEEREDLGRDRKSVV